MSVPIVSVKKDGFRTVGPKIQPLNSAFFSILQCSVFAAFSMFLQCCIFSFVFSDLASESYRGWSCANLAACKLRSR